MKVKKTIPADLVWAGDIMACYGADWVSRGISIGTARPFAPRGLKLGPSHVAIIIPNVSPGGDGGENSWIESTTKAPGATSGVQAHRPHDRVMDYIDAGGRVECYRPSAIDAFSAEERQLLWNLVDYHFLGKHLPYDVAGAILSGTRILKRSRFFASDLSRVFCSELIAALLQRVGRMNRANPTRYNPASLLRELVRCGTYYHAGRVVPSSAVLATQAGVAAHIGAGVEYRAMINAENHFTKKTEARRAA